jgi:vancomycin resistance protein YoaR
MTQPPVRHESQASSDEEERSAHHRPYLWVLVGVIVLFGGAAAVVAFLPVAGTVAKGTWVAGVSVGGLDRAELRQALDGPVAAAVNRPLSVRAGTVAFEIVPAQAGIRLDRTATEQALLGPGRVTLLARIREPKGRRHDVQPVISFDRDAAESALAPQLTKFMRIPRDARVNLARPQPVLEDKGDASFASTQVGVSVIPGVGGREVKVEPALAALRQAVQDGHLDVELPVVTTQPEVGTAALEGVDQLIGSFTTHYICCQPRVTNIRRIAQLIDGSMIAPRATFSLNQAAGRRTAENGFVSAPAIADGELVQQFGGGVSQFSTTLFNATWFAGLPILQHQPHSKYIARYPPGREATLDYDTIDQVIKNDTKAPVVIRTATTDTSVTVALYGHTGRRVVTSTTGPQQPRTGGGFSVNVEREIRDAGALVRTDYLSWTYTGLD